MKNRVFRQPLKKKEAMTKKQKNFGNSIERIEQTVSELLKFLNHADNERANILVRQERDIQSLRAESQKKDEESVELNRQIDKLQAENRRLSDEIKASSDAGEPSDRDDIVREIALKVTGNDQVFGEAIRSLQIDGTLSLQIGSIIENHLKRVLNPSEKLSLYELIELCGDAEILDEESVTLAHTIRKQRNIRAHPSKLCRSKDRDGPRSFLSVWCVPVISRNTRNWRTNKLAE